MEVNGELLLSREPSSVLILEPYASLTHIWQRAVDCLTNYFTEAANNYPTNDELI